MTFRSAAPAAPASLARLQVENGRPCPAGLDLAIFLICRRSDKVSLFGRPPEYLG
jgi:hypothetical protein